MDRPLFRLARTIYRATPWKTVRQFYFRAFAGVVRHRRVVVDVGYARYELDLGEMIDLALYLQEFERDVCRAIRRVARPGMIVLDVGANIGAHSLLLASVVGPTGRVIAFEPTMYAFAKLETNLALNPALRVEAHRLALADETREATTANFRSSWQTDGGRLNTAGQVDLVRLDDWAMKNGLSELDIVKMDVDGAEFSVISGAFDTIRMCRPTFIAEATGLHFSDEARNPFRALVSLGYELWNIEGNQRLTLDALRRRLPEDDAEMSFSVNLIARPSEKPA